MITGISLIQEYPFEGTFYRAEISQTGGLTTRTESKSIILETECDIQQASSSDNGGVNNVTFNIYFPFDTNMGVDIRRGDIFEGNMYGVEVTGEVCGIFPTQLGGCEVHLKDFTV